MGRLSLVDVRNYADVQLDAPAGLNLFTGPNAQGKSNLLEAIGVLATGKSFRTAHEGELVRHAAPRAVISGEAHVRAGIVRLACEIAIGPHGTRKTYRLNGETTQFGRYLGSIRAVTFAPGDLDVVDGAPAVRRAVLNGALSQLDPLYYRELARYTKALAQKRALLRGNPPVDRDLLATYNAQLASAGRLLIAAREAYVQAWSSAAGEAHGALAGEGTLTLTYRSNVAAAALDAALSDRMAQEIARKTALVGPHRDDVEVALDALSLAAFGSQGQKRSAVLALKLAEYAVLRERSGEAPLLLLDDVLSELDRSRQQRFLEQIAPLEQVFLTATELPPRIPSPASLFRIDAGRIEAVAC